MSIFRHPKTTQERRFANKFTRPKRRNLPTVYDDIFVPITRSWKDYRKTQYKVTDKQWVWEIWSIRKRRKKNEKTRIDKQRM